MHVVDNNFVEIERKFLVDIPAFVSDKRDDESWEAAFFRTMTERAGCEFYEITQLYLGTSKDSTTRIRLQTNYPLILKAQVVGHQQAFCTIKVRGESDLARSEYEFDISPVVASAAIEDAISKGIGSVVEKRRFHYIDDCFQLWHIDVFKEHHQIGAVAEIELASERQLVYPLDWASTEVTHDPRYLNSNIAVETSKLFR